MSSFTPEETASILKVTTRTLATWRKNGMGPAFAKVGNAVQYPEAALIDWLAENITLPEPAPAASNTIPLGLLGGVLA